MGMLFMERKEKLTGIYLLALAALLSFGGVLLCLPAVQDIALLLGGRILGRPLEMQGYWRGYVGELGVCSLFLGLPLCFLSFEKLSPGFRAFLLGSLHKNEKPVCIAIALIAFLLFMMPFMILGQDSAITVHDNLDFEVPFFHYIHHNHLFWSFYKELPILDGISLPYINLYGFSLFNAIYCLLPDYVSYIVVHMLSLVMGFLSMFFLQRMIFKNGNLIIVALTSVAYALLPVFPGYRMAVATLPFAAILFCKISKTRELRWLFLSFAYPFVSEFSSVGLFVCFFWFVCTVFTCIRERRIALRLILAFVFICAGFLLVISPLLYVRFVIREPLNRDFLSTDPKPFIDSFIQYFLRDTIMRQHASFPCWTLLL